MCRQEDIGLGIQCITGAPLASLMTEGLSEVKTFKAQGND
jgi:hypothetical protein